MCFDTFVVFQNFSFLVVFKSKIDFLFFCAEVGRGGGVGKGFGIAMYISLPANGQLINMYVYFGVKKIYIYIKNK